MYISTNECKEVPHGQPCHKPHRGKEEQNSHSCTRTDRRRIQQEGWQEKKEQGQVAFVDTQTDDHKGG